MARITPSIVAALVCAGAASSQIDTALDRPPLSADSLAVLPGVFEPERLHVVDSNGEIFVRNPGSASFSSQPALFPTEHNAFAVAPQPAVGGDALYIVRDGPVAGGVGWFLSCAESVVGGGSFVAGTSEFVQFSALEEPRFIRAMDLGGSTQFDAIVVASDGFGNVRALSFVHVASPLTNLMFESEIGLNGGEPEAMEAADLDNDGSVDVAVLMFDGSDASVQLIFDRANGAINTQPPLSISVGGPGDVPMGFALADMNGDSMSDIVVATVKAGDTTIQVLDQASGWTKSTISIPNFAATGAVVVDQLDTDGDLDIAVAGNDGTSEVLRIVFQNMGAYSAVGVQDLLSDSLLNLTTVTENGLTSLIGMAHDGVVWHHVHTPPMFIRGDANADGAVNLADSIALLGFVFNNLPLQDFDAADCNDDGSINIADAIFLQTHLFNNGPPPPPPFGVPGVDPTEDLNMSSPNFDLN